MYTITVVLRIRINKKLIKRKTIFSFDNRTDFEYRLWELLQTDSYRVNEKVATDIVLTVDNGI